MSIDEEAERLADLENVILRLREEAHGSLVLVEGAKDRTALERLGVGGVHLQVNQGASLEVLIDRLVLQVHGGRLRQIVLLLDWDRTGGRLFARLHEGLKARVALETQCRRLLATVCHVRTFEEVPSELAGLRLRLGRVP